MYMWFYLLAAELDGVAHQVLEKLGYLRKIGDDVRQPVIGDGCVLFHNG